MPPDSDRVVITGIGMVTPLGPDRDRTWRAVCAGESGTCWLPPFEPQAAAVHTGSHGARVPTADFLGAPVKLPAGSAPATADLLAALHAQQLDPVVAYAALAADEAIADARLPLSPTGNPRVGCVIGTSKGGLRSFTRFRTQHFLGSPATDDNPSADLWRQFPPAAPAQFLSIRHRLMGAALCPVAACATGLMSVAAGADLVQRGVCDAVLAGSSDASLQEILLASYRRLGVLARCDSAPESACRPFDRTRTGFVPGEGAAVLVLERAASAAARGVAPYAEWLSSNTASDPAHLTRMDTDPRSLAWLIQNVLATAGLSPADLDYINLHGTGTRSNDLVETQAVHAALGAAAKTIPCSSVKGALGHLLGGAGSVELSITLLALRDGLLPPTRNLRHPDPRCDLDYIPVAARRAAGAEVALKLSLGFGGHCVAAVVRRSERPAATPA